MGCLLFITMMILVTASTSSGAKKEKVLLDAQLGYCVHRLFVIGCCKEEKTIKLTNAGTVTIWVTCATCTKLTLRSFKRGKKLRTPTHD